MHQSRELIPTRARRAIDEAPGRLDVEMLARKTDARWSIAELLEHLTLAFTANAASLEKALASGEVRPRTPTLKQTIGRIVVVDVGYFPRVEAPSMTRPNGTIPTGRALTAIREAIDSLTGRSAGWARSLAWTSWSQTTRTSAG